ncbi:MAG: single-stranded DNA-binding protein [Coriobacteriales bacterium]
MSINKVMISGNTTRDAELRSTAGGTPVLTFGVAVNERRRNMNNEWEDYANFIDCSLFGRRAEALAQYLTKGTKVAIEGRLHYSSWEDRNGGGRRSKVEVYVDELEFLSARNNNGGSQYGGSQSYGGGQSRNSGQSYGGGQAYANNGGQAYANSNAGADSQRAQYISEAPAPAAYNDEDIPF